MDSIASRGATLVVVIRWRALLIVVGSITG